MLEPDDRPDPGLGCLIFLAGVCVTGLFILLVACLLILFV